MGYGPMGRGPPGPPGPPGMPPMSGMGPGRPPPGGPWPPSSMCGPYPPNSPGYGPPGGPPHGGPGTPIMPSPGGPMGGPDGPDPLYMMKNVPNMPVVSIFFKNSPTFKNSLTKVQIRTYLYLLSIIHLRNIYIDNICR